MSDASPAKASPRKALFSEVREFLRERSEEVRAALGDGPAEVGLPVDGKGVRIKVSVPAGQIDRAPRELTFKVNDDQVVVPVEADEDFEEAVAQNHVAT